MQKVVGWGDDVGSRKKRSQDSIGKNCPATISVLELYIRLEARSKMAGLSGSPNIIWSSSTHICTRDNRGTIALTPGSIDSSSYNAVVIICHGLGDTADGMLNVAKELSKKLQQVKFILPTAPVRGFRANLYRPMNAWYDLDSFKFSGNQKYNDCDGMDDSASDLHSILRSEHKSFPFIPFSRMSLIGFSQGGATCLFAGLTFHPPESDIRLNDHDDFYVDAVSQNGENGNKNAAADRDADANVDDSVADVNVADIDEQKKQEQQKKPNHIGAIVMLSGYVPPHVFSRTNKSGNDAKNSSNSMMVDFAPEAHRIPILHCHGVSDRMIKFQWARSGQQQLVTNPSSSSSLLRGKVTHYEMRGYRGVKHEIVNTELEDVAEFLFRHVVSAPLEVEKGKEKPTNEHDGDDNGNNNKNSNVDGNDNDGYQCVMVDVPGRNQRWWWWG